MTTRFGYGFETKSPYSPSTQHAQAAFLALLSQLKKEAVIGLFDTAHKPFREFLSDHQNEILLIKGRSEPAPFSMDTATRIFIHSWSALQQERRADQLCLALREWARNWNLTNDWCLNHAVLTLRDQSWDGALYWLETEPIMRQFVVTDKLKQIGVAEFVFRHDTLAFTVEGPFSQSPTQFKHQVEERFKALGGPTIRGARKSLEFRLADYRDQVAKARKVLKLEAPPVRWAADHFLWLIKYQLPPCMKYREIGREFSKDEKTVREGIQRAASLIGLTLRSSESDKRLGRPKGAKDKYPRHRVDRRREKLRGIAN
jgi:hypothetical protein